MASTQQLLLGEGAGGAEKNYIEDVFSTYLYTGSSSAQTITNNIDLATKGGLVWLKGRSAGGVVGGYGDHELFDSSNVGSTRKYLSSDTTDALSANGSISSTPFTTSGFNLTAGPQINNRAGDTTVSWTFRKQPKFFDVVTYTGNGTSQNIAHSLGSVPGCIMVKATSGVSNWFVYHRSLGNANLVYLNATSASASTTIWNSTDPTSTQFSINGTSGNASGVTYVAYIFAHDAGGFGLTGTDNVISCGSYTGNGSTAGPVVTLGYEPQWVLIKSATTSATNWQLFDNMRGMPVGSVDARLVPNLSSAEDTLETLSPTATGFDIVTTSGNINTSGATYIYIAIRRGPMKVPTDATKVFAADLGSSSGTLTYDANFVVDFAIDKSRTVSPSSARASDRLRGANTLTTPTTDAESASNQLWDSNTTFRFNSTGDFSTRIAWLFRRAPSFFDEVCYTGTGSARTVTHNLGVAPQFLLVKRRATSTSNWQCWHVGLPSVNGRIHLNLDLSERTGGGASVFGNDVTGVPPTSSVFYVGSEAEVNGSGDTFVAYLFATCAGVSKVGSYTGTGTTKQVDCGFAAGARFVLIKRTDSTGDWYVWDTARGIVSANDPYLLLNSTAAEVTSTDYIDTYSAGFELSSTAPAALNVSGGTYIFLAIA